MLGLLLLAVGAVSVSRSLFVAHEELPSFSLKPILLVIGSLSACASLLPRAGLIIGLSALMLGTGAASEKFRAE